MGEVKQHCIRFDYLTFSLTDKVSDFSTSSMTGLFDVSEEKWWNEALETLNINKTVFSQKNRKFCRHFSRRKAIHWDCLPTRNSSWRIRPSHGCCGAGLTNSTRFRINRHGAGMRIIITVLSESGINIAPGLREGYYFQMAFNENGATALSGIKKICPELSIEELLRMLNPSPGKRWIKGISCVDKFESL